MALTFKCQLSVNISKFKGYAMVLAYVSCSVVFKWL